MRRERGWMKRTLMIHNNATTCHTTTTIIIPSNPLETVTYNVHNLPHLNSFVNASGKREVDVSKGLHMMIYDDENVLVREFTII